MTTSGAAYPERRRRFTVAVVPCRPCGGARLAVTIRALRRRPDAGLVDRRRRRRLVHDLLPLGLDGISVGIGWHESRTRPCRPRCRTVRGSPTPNQRRVVRASSYPDVRVIASNRMTDLRDGEAVLRDGLVDAVALARPFLADPALVSRSIADASTSSTPASAATRPVSTARSSCAVSCLVNPRPPREVAFPARPTADPKRVDVVGGGPAGLAAAVDAARRGHDVTVWEASDRLGGQFGLAATVPGKEDYAAAVRAARGARRAWRDRPPRRPATAADLAGSDAVVLAAGVVPRAVTLPVRPAARPVVRAGPARGGPGRYRRDHRGGGIGVDTAAFLTESPDEAVRATDSRRRAGTSTSRGARR